MQAYEGQRSEIKLSDRVTVEVRELNANEAELADMLAAVPDGASNMMVFRAIAATRAFFAVTKINGEPVAPVVDATTLGRMRSYFSAREGMALMDLYAQEYVMTEEEKREPKKLINSPLTKEIALMMRLGFSFTEARLLTPRYRLAYMIVLGELHDGQFDMDTLTWRKPPNFSPRLL